MATALPDEFMNSAESRDATNTTIIQTLLNTFYLQSVACLHNNDGGGKASQSLSLLSRAVGVPQIVGRYINYIAIRPKSLLRSSSIGQF